MTLKAFQDANKNWTGEHVYFGGGSWWDVTVNGDNVTVTKRTTEPTAEEKAVGKGSVPRPTTTAPATTTASTTAAPTTAASTTAAPTIAAPTTPTAPTASTASQTFTVPLEEFRANNKNWNGGSTHTADDGSVWDIVVEGDVVKATRRTSEPVSTVGDRSEESGNESGGSSSSGSGGSSSASSGVGDDVINAAIALLTANGYTITKGGSVVSGTPGGAPGNAAPGSPNSYVNPTVTSAALSAHDIGLQQENYRRALWDARETARASMGDIFSKDMLGAYHNDGPVLEGADGKKYVYDQENNKYVPLITYADATGYEDYVKGLTPGLEAVERRRWAWNRANPTGDDVAFEQYLKDAEASAILESQARRDHRQYGLFEPGPLPSDKRVKTVKKPEVKKSHIGRLSIAVDRRY